MPIGEIAFNPCPAGTAFVGAVGLDYYTILKPSIMATATGGTPQWIALYLGNGALASVGNFDNYNAAFNAVQAHLAALAT